MKNLLLVCLVTLLHWATSAAALRVFPSASSSPVLCEAEKRAISPRTEVRVATVRVDNTDKSFRIATYGKNDIVSGSILAHGRWEPSTLEHLKTALANKKGSVYLDIGANIGYFALYVAALGYHVIAVEASQENANLIRYSLCLNPELKSRIKLHHVALAEKRMRCLLASPEGNSGNMNMDCKEEEGRALDFSGWMHWSGRRQREEVVMTVPLDEVVGRDERVDVLKIDTEGFEYHALVGGQKHVLPKIRSVFSEFSPFMLRKQHTDPVAYLELLRKHGLQVHYQGDIVRDFAAFSAGVPRDTILDISAARKMHNEEPNINPHPSILQEFIDANERCTPSGEGIHVANQMELFELQPYIQKLDDLFFQRYLGSHYVKLDGPRIHRKDWELGWIMKVLHDNNVLRAGKKGIVFAAGVEPLPSYVASYGAEILCTDHPGSGWGLNQNARSLDSLFYPELVQRDEFFRLARFMPVDMNKLEVLQGETFDFIWSTCSIEHVGSIDLGIEFVRRSSMLLKPGGVAVHTVEFNLGSNDATVKTGQTAIWRKQDVEKMIRMIEDEGLEIAGEPCYAVGTDTLDLQPDLCSTRCPTHPNHTDVIKIMLAGYPVTSLGFVVTRPHK
ncbi:methyltransferase [Pycnococcus provasolii]